MTELNVPSSSGSPNGFMWLGWRSSSGSSKGLMFMAGGASGSSSSRKFSLLISSIVTECNTKSHTHTYYSVKTSTEQHISQNEMNTNIHKPKNTNICTLEWTISIKTIQSCWRALPKLLCSSATSAPLQCMYSSGNLGKFVWYGMEGYCGRQWRQYRVAMEIRAGKAENCPLYLHHRHCSSIACCQGVGQLEKSANVCEVDAKKGCWALRGSLSKEKKCCVFVKPLVYM